MGDRKTERVKGKWMESREGKREERGVQRVRDRRSESRRDEVGV